jgi:hypothetical protein
VVSCYKLRHIGRADRYASALVPPGMLTLAESLPVLFDDGIATATGFEDIVSYLRNHPGVVDSFDANLTSQQQNDRSAFSTLFESTATPLIDLSLFVSAENYNTTTSSAFTAILPWYANYTVPPKRRDLARTRTAHMGLGSLDMEPTEEGFAPGRGTASAEFEAAKRAAGLPTDSQPTVMSMGRGKGIGGLLGAPKYAARFKLDAVTGELLDPLSDLLGQSHYLLGGEHPSSLDCLAFGYLSLMFYPVVPQAWIKETIEKKYPRIATYIQRLRQEFFGDEEVDAAAVWSRTARGTLPWHAKSRSLSSSLSPHTYSAAREIVGNLPVISSLTHRQTTLSEPSPTRSLLPSPVFVNTLLGLTAACAVGFISLAVRHRRSPRDGDLIFWALTPSNGLGEAGNILSILGQLPSQDAFSQF